MVHRRSMPKRSDSRRFTRTAVRSKKVNLNPTIYRGGIRL